ncbi:hypothetical protein PMAYCL1PPCAC_19610, partial [Pristionchus mayeri]
RNSMKAPCTKGAPFRYMYINQLLHPPEDNYGIPEINLPVKSEMEPHETIRLCDVEAFSKRTAEKDHGNSIQEERGESAGKSLTTSPVIYRYIDVIKNSFALLEAIHFELFMPDSPDLRFLAIPFATVPIGTVEGDYFRVPDADLLSNPSFAVQLGSVEYPAVWEAKNVEKMHVRGLKEYTGLAYIVKKKADIDGYVAAISEIFDCDFPIRESLFPDEDSRREHSIVWVTMRDMATAHLHAVEPPGGLVYDTAMQVLEHMGIHLEKEEEDGAAEVTKEEKGDTKCEYLNRVRGVLTSSQRTGRVVTAVRALSATETARIEDRLGAFKAFGGREYLHWMIKLFRLGIYYRVSESRGVDWRDFGTTKIDESTILKTLMDNQYKNFAGFEKLLPLFYWKANEAILNHVNKTISVASAPDQIEQFRNCGGLELNDQQA